MQRVLRINKKKYKDEQLGNFLPLWNDRYRICTKTFTKIVVYEAL